MKKNIAIKANAMVATAGMALALCADPVRAQTNLVANGSFEAGPAGENAFTDWPLVNGADNDSNYGVTTNSTPPDVSEQGNILDH
jgi:hypothetical protein